MHIVNQRLCKLQYIILMISSFFEELIKNRFEFIVWLYYNKKKDVRGDKIEKKK